MKKRVLVACILSLAFLAAVASFAQGTYKFQIPGDREPFYGTWVNKEYANKPKTFPKFVYHNWGYAEGFRQISDETAAVKFTFILVEKWTDSKGNAWYKELEQAKGAKNYLLCRISKDGTTLEQIYRSAGFPAESDLSPKYPNYWIFRRK